MAKFKELREAKNLQAKQVAEAAGIDPTMYSRFENYRVLPIPEDFRKLLDVLGCAPSDIYANSEVLLLPETNNVRTVGGAKTNSEPSEYKMTVRLDNGCREVLTKEVLQNCGYKSIGEWITACIQKLKSQYEAVLKDEKKNPARLGEKTRREGKERHTTIKPKPDSILSQNNQNVKEDIPQ